MKEYVALGGLPLAVIDTATGTPVMYAVHTDHLGTPRIMTDATGAEVWRIDARPFGETVAITGTAANDNRFPGQVFDAESGLHYNYFRDYDPTLGRYLQSDPIGLGGGLNTYAYVNGRPIEFFDPFGLWSEEAHHYFMDQMFGGQVPEQGLRALKRGSSFADKTFPYQLPGYEHMHAMLEDGLTEDEAKQKACEYFKEKIAMYKLNLKNNRIYDAYFSLGMALHVVQDSTSPPHNWGSFNILSDTLQHGDFPLSEETLQNAMREPYRSSTLDAMERALAEMPDFCMCE